MGEERSLPPISDLLKESWKAFTKSILNLLLLAVVTTVAYAVVFGVILLLAGLGGGFGFLKSLFDSGSGGAPSLTTLLPMLTGVGLGLIFFILFAIVFGLMVQAASIIIIGEYERKPSLGEALSRGFGLMIPLFLTNLILFFFGFGGVFVLVLPAIIFAILFTFTPYEVVLGEKKFLEAIKGSYRMVTQHFGDLVVRGLVWLGLVILIYLVLAMPSLMVNVMTRVGDEAGLVFVPLAMTFSLIRFLINAALGWFGLCYGVILYKQAKAVTDFGRKASFGWVWMVAILGWVLAGIVGLASYSWVNKLVKTGLRQKNLQENIQREIFEEKRFEELEETEDWEELQRELEKLREEMPQSKFLPEG